MQSVFEFPFCVIAVSQNVCVTPLHELNGARRVRGKPRSTTQPADHLGTRRVGWTIHNSAQWPHGEK